MARTLVDFWAALRTVEATSGWRVGQALFNLLEEARPDIADALRGTAIDPFEATDKDDNRYVHAVLYIQQEWDRK